MPWLYGQTWIWYLLAFLVGLALARVLLVRPQQRRLRAASARPEGRSAGEGPPAAAWTPAAPVGGAQAVAGSTGAGVAEGAGATGATPAGGPAAAGPGGAGGPAPGGPGAGGPTPDPASTRDAAGGDPPPVDPALSTLDTAGFAVVRRPDRAPAGPGPDAGDGTTPYGPDSAYPGADGGAPGAEFAVKGNADTMLFHTPDSPYYVRTRASAWFRSPEAAVAAGFAPWNHRRKDAALEGLASAADEAPDPSGA